MTGLSGVGVPVIWGLSWARSHICFSESKASQITIGMLLRRIISSSSLFPSVFSIHEILVLERMQNIGYYLRHCRKVLFATGGVVSHILSSLSRDVVPDRDDSISPYSDSLCIPNSTFVLAFTFNCCGSCSPNVLAIFFTISMIAIHYRIHYFSLSYSNFKYPSYVFTIL